MKLAIMQPYFFPYLGYFQLIQAADKFVLYSACQYTSGSWITRNRIALKNTSSTFMLSVPVKKCPVGTLIREVEIQYSGNHWQSDLLKHIRFNYMRSPFFSEVFPVIQQIIAGNTFSTIAELNACCVTTLARKLSISTEIQTDNACYAEVETRIKGAEPELRRVWRILEICRQEQCNHYLNAPGGQELYRKGDFLNQGIELSFVQMNAITYPSVSSYFLPNLSIIDVLMQNGWEGTGAMLNCFTLK